MLPTTATLTYLGSQNDCAEYPLHSITRLSRSCSVARCRPRVVPQMHHWPASPGRDAATVARIASTPARRSTTPSLFQTLASRASSLAISGVQFCRLPASRMHGQCKPLASVIPWGQHACLGGIQACAGQGLVAGESTLFLRWGAIASSAGP